MFTGTDVPRADLIPYFFSAAVIVFIFNCILRYFNKKNPEIAAKLSAWALLGIFIFVLILVIATIALFSILIFSLLK